MSAEAFGFGPSSKLQAICRELGRRDVETHFAGVGVSLMFARGNAASYSSIEPIDRMDELARIQPDGFDGVLSVMDPFAVVWAACHGLPSLYVDSLYWFWRWDDLDETELRSEARRLCGSADVATALRRFADVPMHASQCMAHLLATAACVQRSRGAVERQVARRDTGGPTIVDAIVDLSERTPAEPECWLMSASGMLNSLISMDQAVDWVHIVSELVVSACDEVGAAEPVMLAGNGDVLEVFRRTNGAVSIISTDHANVLQTLNTAVACLAPPGLTTMFECSAYGTPLILLPEQHYGHLANYQAVEAWGRRETFPHALLNTVIPPDDSSDVLAETQAIFTDLRDRYEAGGSRWHELVSAVATGMEAVRRDRAAAHAVQDEAVRAFVGGYAGVEQVADVLEEVIENPSVSRSLR